MCCSVLKCVAKRQSSIHWRIHAATHCNTLQRTTKHCNTFLEPRTQHVVEQQLQNTTTHCNTLQRTASQYNTLQHTATHCNTLQHTATDLSKPARNMSKSNHCSALQLTATHHITTATHCITLQYTATRYKTFVEARARHDGEQQLQHTTAHRNTVQHTATHCNTLQHTATYYNTGSFNSRSQKNQETNCNAH